MNKKSIIIKSLIALVIALIAISVLIIVLKYNEEGEQALPFKISKVIVASTVEGIDNVGATEKWNMNVIQNNDIYISFEKTDKHDGDAKIDNITINNIKVKKGPTKGNILAYMPSSEEGRLFVNSEQFVVWDKLQYKGSVASNAKTLEVGNQGGTIYLRLSNQELDSYVSEEDTEIKHDGTLLPKIGVSLEDIKCTVSFDVILSIEDKDYTANIILDLPSGDIVEKGSSVVELNNEEQFVFKR